MTLRRWSIGKEKEGEKKNKRREDEEEVALHLLFLSSCPIKALPGKFSGGAESTRGHLFSVSWRELNWMSFSFSETIFYCFLRIITHKDEKKRKMKNRKKKRGFLLFFYWWYSNDLSCWSAWMKSLVQFRSASSLRANGVSRFLRNEQPSVRRALPPDGEQST